MCSRPFCPHGLPIYVARLPRLHSLVATLASLSSISEIPLKLIRVPALSPATRRGFTFYFEIPVSSIPRLFVCHHIVENKLSYRQRLIRPLARVVQSLCHCRVERKKNRIRPRENIGKSSSVF